MINAFLDKRWIVIVLTIGALAGAYYVGGQSKDKDWQLRWEARNAANERAKAAYEQTQRDIERGLRDDLANQLEINNQQRIESERVKSLADATLVSVRGEADALRLRLKRAGDAAGNTESVSSITRAAMVLTDLLVGCTAERQEVSGAFDESRRRALNVEKMYDKARGH